MRNIPHLQDIARFGSHEAGGHSFRSINSSACTRASSAGFTKAFRLGRQNVYRRLTLRVARFPSANHRGSCKQPEAKVSPLPGPDEQGADTTTRVCFPGTSLHRKQHRSSGQIPWSAPVHCYRIYRIEFWLLLMTCSLPGTFLRNTPQIGSKPFHPQATGRCSSATTANRISIAVTS